MIFSNELMFSDDQAITTTAASTNVIDLGAAQALLGNSTAQAQDIGRGVPIPISIQVTESFAGGTNLQVQVQTDSTAAFSSATTVLESETVATASLVAGYQFHIIHLPPGLSEQFVRLNYTVSGTHTAGKVTAGIVGATSQVL